MTAPAGPPAEPIQPAEPARPPVALSTMWAVQPRFERDLRAFMERAVELGYEAVEINHSMDAAQIGAILGHDVLPVTNVHAPAPLERHSSLGWNRELDLAAEDERERGVAVDFTQRSIDCAVEAGAGTVVVHLGAVSRRPINGDRRLRRALTPDARARPRPTSRTRARSWRRSASAAGSRRPRWSAPLARSRSWCATRSRTAWRSALEGRLNFHEIPLPEEAAELLAPYSPTAAGYWHDVGHAEVLHRLGLVERSAWFDLLGERLLGVHISDVAGLRDHRAPGRGRRRLRLACGAPARAGRAHARDRSARARRGAARGAHRAAPGEGSP